MADENEQRYEQTFTVGKRAELTLRNVRGPITITGWDQPQVSIVAIKQCGTEWGAGDIFKDTTVEMEQDGAQVRVRTTASGGSGYMGWLGGSSFLGWIGIGRTPPLVSYTIQVPATSDVSVRSVSSDIVISRVMGSIYAKTVNGSIALNALSGQIITSVVDAPVQGSELAGTLATKAVAGNVIIKQSRLMSSWSKSVDGDVSLETTIDPAGDYKAHSVSGSLTLFVPPGAKVSASMHGISGRAICDLPCTITEQTRGRWSGEINGGGAAVGLKTVSGDLSLRAATNFAAAAEATPPPAQAAEPANADWPEMSILKAVERGELSVEAAVAKLAALDQSSH